MAITALYSAASGLRALSTQIDVVSNNLANAETTAFKSGRVNFQDLVYLTLKQPGVTSSAGDVAPSALFVGLGTRADNTQIDLTQGSLKSTNGQLDVAIRGNGFCGVRMIPSLGDGMGYTGAEIFFKKKKNELVVGRGEGSRLVPPISIPSGTTDITI